MKQAKKIFTRMCINNWGGIDHKILEFNEYVNLFSGKSGSGKSTVMDAIQVILYGSFSANFLNKAADDAKNKRSVLSYLRGEQKDGSANRDGQDFCSTIVLEIEDTGTHLFTCIGIAFEVRKNDSELKKYMYFSHAGKIPESEYCTEDGYPYFNKDIRKLIEERSRLVEEDGKRKGDVNRIYPSKESYLGNLYDVILGYIDGNRFVTMEKSAIALKMSNGTGQFIRDYMFPKSEGTIIEKISEQLRAYRDIKEKIDELKKKIDMLTDIHESGTELLRVQTELIRLEAFIRCVDIKDLETVIQSFEEDKQAMEEELQKVNRQRTELEEVISQNEEELIQARVELDGSDLGREEERLKALQDTMLSLTDRNNQWKKVIQGLFAWENNEVVAEFLSNPLLNAIKAFAKGKVTQEDVAYLKGKIEEAKENLDGELETTSEERRAVERELKEKERLVDDLKNNRKSYPENLRQARAALERKLSDSYGRTINVFIFADLFDVQEEEWKNAIEGRMGRLKLSLITQPQYAHDAAVAFRNMKQFEEIDLINSAAIAKSDPQVLENSLYDAVTTKEQYVDVCLKRYLGHIVKCESVDDLEQVRDGVTKDCYSYSNFIFRHLRKKDYTTYACIGSKVSKAKLKEYEEELETLKKEFAELKYREEQFKASVKYESLNEDSDYIVRLSMAEKELEKARRDEAKLMETIASLREGKFKELKEHVTVLEERKRTLNGQKSSLDMSHEKLIFRIAGREKEIESKKFALEDKKAGYIPNEELEREVEQALQEHRSSTQLKNQANSKREELEAKEQEYSEQRANSRNRYIHAYPNCGFSGMEKTNEAYDVLLEKYHNDYEPEYQAEFAKQCDLIYKILRENVIATIHGDIKAANRHKNEINRMLRDTNFSDSTYQIKIEPAKNENGQFYEMLMAKELDSKNVDYQGCEGQLSLGEDEFYQKYEQKIKLLIDKFMPPKDGDERLIEQRQREMEQYADYRNYLSFSMFEQVTDEHGNVIRENFVDEMAGRDSGGEGQNPKYVALLAGFAMLYMQQSVRDSKIKLVLLDEAFSKMDQERSEVCLNYARRMNLQLIVCVPDERLQSLIRNVDCVYGFRRYKNHISMMHIDKGNYLKMMEGEEDGEENGEAGDKAMEVAGEMAD